MPNITIPTTELASRGNEIQRILIPLAKRKGGPAWQRRILPTECVIGTHDGSPPSSNYRGWTFATIRADFRAQYFERWLKFEEDGQELWFLERAYLNVYRFDRSRDGREFVCLHTDPNHTVDDKLKKSNPVLYRRLLKQAPYKTLPHIHVIVAEPPFPHAHLALSVEHKDQVLSSVDTLSQTMRSGVQLFRDEVFDTLGL